MSSSPWLQRGDQTLRERGIADKRVQRQRAPRIGRRSRRRGMDGCALVLFYGDEEIADNVRRRSDGERLRTVRVDDAGHFDDVAIVEVAQRAAVGHIERND